MMLQLTAPSKTFLLGEYAVVQGGPAIIMSTSPRFQLTATNECKATLLGIDPLSPGGKLVEKYNNDFAGYAIEFTDPYHHLGGFGASGAQFILLYALREYLKNKNQPIDVITLLNEYNSLAWDGKGLPPSGADIIAQKYGKICYFHKNKQIIETFLWPFPDLAYCLIHTGYKLATHYHLAQLKKIPTEKLEKVVLKGRKSIQQIKTDLFIESIKDYAKLLAEQGLVTQETQNILNQLNANGDVLAAKGCGALGADVILVITRQQKIKNLIEWLKNQKLNVIVYGNRLAAGLTLKQLVDEGS